MIDASIQLALLKTDTTSSTTGMSMFTIANQHLQQCSHGSSIYIISIIIIIWYFAQSHLVSNDLSVFCERTMQTGSAIARQSGFVSNN